MPVNSRTHIFCYDDYRSFSEDVRKRFSDDTRYRIYSFQASDELLLHIANEKEKALCRAAILGMHDNRDQMSLIEKLSQEIRNIDPAIGIILLVPPEKIDEINKSTRFNSLACIPRNSNSILRIHNSVKSLISERSITRFRKRRNLSLTILLIFLALCLSLIILAKIWFPQYF